MTTTVTDDQIITLREEAGSAGDTEMVATCQRALGGSVRARRAVGRHLVEAQEEFAYQAWLESLITTDRGEQGAWA